MFAYSTPPPALAAYGVKGGASGGEKRDAFTDRALRTSLHDVIRFT